MFVEREPSPLVLAGELASAGIDVVIEAGVCTPAPSRCSSVEDRTAS